ncbi:MAG: transporter [Eubacterium sp.]|nr:transporter [Eubacterium sp.]
MGRISRKLEIHLLFFVYSCTGIISKYAGRQPFLSVGYCLGYTANMLILAAFTLAWQQILKKENLSSVYMYKAMTVVWGNLFGILLFQERLSEAKAAGMGMILVGICLVMDIQGREQHGIGGGK